MELMAKLRQQNTLDWTRQESLFLIQGKKVVESQIQEGHRSISAFGPTRMNPSGIQSHHTVNSVGVNRGSVQCQKRWSNILVDFKKIKTMGISDEGRGVLAMPAVPLALLTTIIDAEERAEKRKQMERRVPTRQLLARCTFQIQGKEKCPESSKCTGSTSQERWKRRRLSLCVSEDKNMGDRLIMVLERNNSMLNAQLEAHNINCQLDRDQRKEHLDSMITTVNKLTDALLRIANKF
ncbi:hypothetical protein Patl1_01317 [Pistacia atlantica]|uniref:Uncharacterized protein n=1 Tax=Pistacia atlantica TaxID=434234 RepID=A0ACC1C6P9_9ROSI|nr:hypothetical protein Patl1_01317 [Pistacia atlantica]